MALSGVTRQSYEVDYDENKVIFTQGDLRSLCLRRARDRFVTGTLRAVAP